MVSASLDLPELQGEPEYVAAEKCKWASEQVSSSWDKHGYSTHMYIVFGIGFMDW